LTKKVEKEWVYPGQLSRRGVRTIGKKGPAGKRGAAKVNPALTARKGRDLGAVHGGKGEKKVGKVWHQVTES